jgi:hypothetical protein
MTYKFAYKLGHVKELSINEFYYLSGDKDYKIVDDFIITNSDVDIDETGSLVFKAIILDDIYELPKKIGYYCPIKQDKKTLLNELKSKGAKKILISDTMPNIGQFKYVKNWILDLDKFILQIVQYANQDFWGDIDMSLPEKDMKKGIINLKLARSMLNFTSYKNVCDPFAGFGRNAIAGWDKHMTFCLSDNDPVTENYMINNINYITKVYGNDSKVLNIKIEDANDMKDNFNEAFAVVTEGDLSESANTYLTTVEIKNRISEIKNFWLEILDNWSHLGNLKDIVLTLPFYINKEEKLFWDIKKDLNKNYTHQPFVNSDYIFYSRKDTRIGHMIVKLTK